jgi:hypothetical protein
MDKERMMKRFALALAVVAVVGLAAAGLAVAGEASHHAPAATTVQVGNPGYYYGHGAGYGHGCCSYWYPYSYYYRAVPGHTTVVAPGYHSYHTPSGGYGYGSGPGWSFSYSY